MNWRGLRLVEGWTRARRKKHSQYMRAAYARKKALENEKESEPRLKQQKALLRKLKRDTRIWKESKESES